MPASYCAESVERACERIAVLASDCMDAGRLEEFARYHTDDTEFIRPSTYPGDPLRGIQEILAVLRARDPLMISRHVLTNVAARAMSATEATGSAYFIHFAGGRQRGSDIALPIEGALLSMGEYQMQFRCVSGTWKIHRRVGRFIFGAAFRP